jgi:hypothetical protein
MREIRRFRERSAGVASPWSGSITPTLVGLGLMAALSAGCTSDDYQESLPILQVGMINDPMGLMPPIYDDGELQIFEVKKGTAFPILNPTDVTRDELNQIDVEPYGRRPWVTTDDIDVQVTWTLSNLDDEEHVVELLVDPWNEFGRYYPGMQLTNADDEEYMPNFSGIDKRYILGAKSKGQASRVHGTYTFADLKEVATDLATVMDLLKNPPVLEGDPDDTEDPTAVIAGLTGLDIGFRTYEPANVALEVAVEVVDKNGKRVRREGEGDKELLRPTEEIITVGVVP